MAIEIVDFPINSMVIFHSYVKLPEVKIVLRCLSMFTNGCGAKRTPSMVSWVYSIHLRQNGLFFFCFQDHHHLHHPSSPSITPCFFMADARPVCERSLTTWACSAGW